MITQSELESKALELYYDWYANNIKPRPAIFQSVAKIARAFDVLLALAVTALLFVTGSRMYDAFYAHLFVNFTRPARIAASIAGPFGFDGVLFLLGARKRIADTNSKLSAAETWTLAVMVGLVIFATSAYSLRDMLGWDWFRDAAGTFVSVVIVFTSPFIDWAAGEYVGALLVSITTERARLEADAIAEWRKEARRSTYWTRNKDKFMREAELLLTNAQNISHVKQRQYKSRGLTERVRALLSENLPKDEIIKRLAGEGYNPRSVSAILSREGGA